MKIKIIVGLLVVSMMLSGLVVGCGGGQPTVDEPEKTTTSTASLDFRQVSVGEMTLSVPGPMTWEHTRIGYITPKRNAAPEGMIVDAYNKRYRHIMLYIGWWDRKQSAESEGTSWPGWDSALEAEGKTKEQFTAEIAVPLMLGAEEVTRTGERQLTINGKEAWELQFTGLKEGQPALIFAVAIFGEDEVGLLVAWIDEDIFGSDEVTWHTIRDSVELSK